MRLANAVSKEREVRKRQLRLPVMASCENWHTQNLTLITLILPNLKELPSTLKFVCILAFEDGD